MKRKSKGLAGFYENNKALVWISGAVALVGGAYCIYRATSKGGAFNLGKQNIASASMNSTNNANVVANQASGAAQSNYTQVAAAPKGFPLKKGSEKELVKEMQQYLIDIAGTKRILPKYGADGDFGNETVSALKTYFGVSEITEEQFDILKRASPMWWSNGTGMFTNLREVLIQKTFPNFNKAALLNIDKQAR